MNKYVKYGIAGFVTICLISAAAGGAESEQYTITLRRPVKVGQRLHVTGQGSRQRTVTAVIGTKERRVETDDLSVSFDAKAEVLKVDPLGRPALVAYTVSRCTMVHDGQTTVIAPASAVLVARRNENGTVFELDGQPVDRNAGAALALVAGLHGEGVSDDDLIATDEPRRLGESWSINLERAVETLQQAGVAVSPSEVSGMSSLHELKEYKGEPCLVIRNRITTRNQLPDRERLPSGFEIRQASVTTMNEGFLPRDERLPLMRHSTNVIIDAALTGSIGSNADEAEMRISGTEVVVRETTLLPEDASIATVTP